MAVIIKSKDIFDLHNKKLIKNAIKNVEYSYIENNVQKNVEISNHISVNPYEVNSAGKWIYTGRDSKKNGKYINNYAPGNGAIPSVYTCMLDFNIIRSKWFLNVTWTGFGDNPSYLKYNITYVDTATNEMKTLTRIQTFTLSPVPNPGKPGEEISLEPIIKVKENTVSINMIQDIILDDSSAWLVTNIDMVLVGTFINTEIKKERKNTEKLFYTLPVGEFTTSDAYFSDSYFTSQEMLAINIIEQWSKGKETAEVLCQIGEYYDEQNKLVISTKDPNKYMTFHIGTYVIPYILSAQGKEVAISYSRKKDSLGNYIPKTFRIVGVEITYDGVPMQKLTLQEV